MKYKSNIHRAEEIEDPSRKSYFLSKDFKHPEGPYNLEGVIMKDSRIQMYNLFNQ